MCGGSLPCALTDIEMEINLKIQQEEKARVKSAEQCIVNSECTEGTSFNNACSSNDKAFNGYKTIGSADRIEEGKDGGTASLDGAPAATKKMSIREHVAYLTKMMDQMAEEDHRLREQVAKAKREREEITSSIKTLENEVGVLSEQAKLATNDLRAAQDQVAMAAANINNSFLTLRMTSLREHADTLWESYDMKPSAFKGAGELVKNNFTYIDNFLGRDKVEEIRSKLKERYDADTAKEEFQQGQLGGGKTGTNVKYSLQHVRGDRIKWFDGTEAGMEVIGHCLLKVDKMLAIIQGMVSELSEKTIARDTAMAAIYPEGSAGYVRHIDNPHRNGRVLTTILYLNLDWNSTHGGQLRIYNADDSHVDVDPVGDRLLIFYSDSRVPHQVLETNHPRFALTTWYFDVQEKNEALLRAVTSDGSVEEELERKRIENEMKAFERGGINNKGINS